MVLRLATLLALGAGVSLQAQDPGRVPVQIPASATTPARTKAAEQGALPSRATLVPVQLGWLGFRTDPNDPALIVEVAPQSPAEQVGMRAGDRIIASDELRAAVQTPATAAEGAAQRSERGAIVGRTYNVTVHRGDETLTFTMVAAALPGGQRRLLLPTRAPAGHPDTVEAEALAYRTELARTLQPARRTTVAPLRRDDLPDDGTGRRYIVESFGTQRRMTLDYRANAIAGAELEQLNPALGQYFGGISEGVFVLRVGAESPAAAAGLEPGDIVQSVNGRSVSTMSALRQEIGDESGPITLGIVRKGRPAEVTLRKEESR